MHILIKFVLLLRYDLIIHVKRARRTIFHVRLLVYFLRFILVTKLLVQAIKAEESACPNTDHDTYMFY